MFDVVGNSIDRMVGLLKEVPSESTPAAFVDLDRVAEGVQLAQRAHPRIRVAYALKASYHRPVLDMIRSKGASISVFSDLEMTLALAAGFAPKDIVYNGFGREGADLCSAIDSGVTVNLESFSELKALLQARRMDSRPGQVGVRVNATGDDQSLSKYGVLGIPMARLPEVADLLRGSGVLLNGISFHHFANQIDTSGHHEVVERLRPILAGLAKHESVSLGYIDVGGGLTSRMNVADSAAVEAFRSLAELIDAALGCDTVYELGRFLVGDAEFLLSRVVDIRRDGDLTFAILDATTNYLIPAPGHRFRVERLESAAIDEVPIQVRFLDRMGSLICQNECSPLVPGALVGVLNAGAYAGVMKEPFVYPLPSLFFLEGGIRTVAPVSNALRVVQAHHLWPES